MKQQGFTLIEVLMACVVLAILAAVAFPSYQNSVQKTRRAEAVEALTKAASMQERHFFKTNQYTHNTADLGGESSAAGHYAISVLASSEDCPITACYSIVASAQGAQAKDTRCGRLSIDHTGRKRSFDTGQSPPADNTSTGDCW